MSCKSPSSPCKGQCVQVPCSASWCSSRLLPWSAPSTNHCNIGHLGTLHLHLPLLPQTCFWATPNSELLTCKNSRHVLTMSDFTHDWVGHPRLPAQPNDKTRHFHHVVCVTYIRCVPFPEGNCAPEAAVHLCKVPSVTRSEEDVCTEVGTWSWRWIPPGPGYMPNTFLLQVCWK